MIVGLNEKLEKLLAGFRDGDSDVDAPDVLDCIAESVAAGDCWYVPVKIVAEDEDEADIEESFELGELPMFHKLVVTDEEGGRFFCAFTSEEAMYAGCGDGTRVSVKYAARAMLRDLLSEDAIEGLVLNPWTEGFVIGKENAEKLLEVAARIPEDVAASYRSYRLEPKAVIDTNEILESWREGWHDEDGVLEPWELVNYPVMPDGHILLLFKMDAEIMGGHVSDLKVIHRESFYRVLEIGVEDGKPEVLNKYRFKFQDAHVGTAFLHDGVLSVAVSVEGKDKYDVLQVMPNDDERQYTIYRDVETLVTDSEGNVVVAYCRNLRDPARYPVMVFNRDGKVIERYYDEHALTCLDVNLDSDERVWFHLHPSATLDVMDRGKRCVESHKVALQGLRAFALSTDRSKLYAAYTEYEGGSAHYVMTLDEHGDYVNPMRFEFRPTDKDGKNLETKDCEVFGQPSTMKSWVLLNADGRLYLYDIDDCCEG